MKPSTKISIIAAGALALAGVAASVAPTFAAGSTATGTDLISRIASTFNLDKTKVQAVFDEDRASHAAEMQEKVAEKLDSAVTAGTITAAQKEAIVAKQAELKTKFEEIRALTDDSARRTAMDQLRTDTEAWAKSQGIEERLLRPGMGGRGHGGPRGDMMRGDAPETVPAPNTAVQQ